MKLPIARLLPLLAVPVIILTAVMTVIFWQQNKTKISFSDYGEPPPPQLIKHMQR